MTAVLGMLLLLAIALGIAAALRRSTLMVAAAVGTLAVFGVLLVMLSRALDTM